MRLVGSEEELCLQLARWMQLQYPTVPFHFDFGSGTKLNMSQARRQRALNAPGWPDLFIAYATFVPNTSSICGGLFLELKRQGTRIKKRDGSWANDHIAEQAAVLDKLAQQGYVAQFAVGFDEATALIDSYFRPGARRYKDREWAAA